MDPTLRLQGDGFVLRRWLRRDLDALVWHANDEMVSRYLTDRFPHPYTRQDGEAFLSGQVLNLDGPLFAIEVDGLPRGNIGGHRGNGPRAHAASIGYWLARPFWGKGLMTRVVGLYVPWLIAEYGVRRVSAQVLPENPGSVRVLEKNGFVEEGLMRAAVMHRGQPANLRLFARIDEST